MYASTDPDPDPDPGSAPAPRSGKPWRTALAGLLLLGIAGGLMAYGAPSRAAVPSHSQPAQQAAKPATLHELPRPGTIPGEVRRLQEGSGEDLRSAIPRSSPEAWCRHT